MQQEAVPLVNGRPSVRMAHRLPVQRELSLRLYLGGGLPALGL